MLNMTKVELELFAYPDMFIFFEKGLTGGVSYISIRYSEANKKRLTCYDRKEESKYVIFDSNR